MTRDRNLFAGVLLLLVVGFLVGASDDGRSGCGTLGETASSSVDALGCSCTDPGVTLTPIQGCEKLVDMNECSAWERAAFFQGEPEGGTYPDGTELTDDIGCTLRINCP